jgi:3-hydroxybutyrate dehydrogenase
MTNKRSAIVTGSTSGIGLGMAAAFAEQGLNVMLNGFGDVGEIEAIRSRLASENRVDVGYHGADMTRPEEIGALFRAAEDKFGAVDIVVNNAGIQFVAPIEEFPPEKWDAIIAINLSSAFHLIRHAIPGMKRRGWGRK